MVARAQFPLPRSSESPKGSPGSRQRTLVLGWGNPGRRDDGLGPALVARLEAGGEDGLLLETDYQLQIEHAADLAECDRVIFVDADRSGPEPFSCRPVEPEGEPLRFTSHEVSPGAVLALCKELSGESPEAWILGVRGYDFDEFGEGLSAAAEKNLQRAEAFVRKALRGSCLECLPRADRMPVCGDREGE